jgi:hypothetical protein
MKPFLSGRPHVSASALHPLSGAAKAKNATSGGMSALAGGPSGHVHGEEKASPTIETIKEGDRVARIVVTCACGERVEIDCLYPN